MSQGQSITFFIDRCLGSQQIAQVLRNTGILIEIHDDHFAKNAQDVDWLPEVGRRGWVILTKDTNIGKRPLKRIAVANANIKMFTLASQNLAGKDMAEILSSAIGKMKKFAQKYPAPFIAKVYRDGKVEMWKDAQILLFEMRQSQNG
jgi:predicted nuclease of predicted toxin-antitoxin system